MLEKIIENYLNHNSCKELALIEDLAFIFVNNRYNLNIDSYPFKDYIIKSDTLGFVSDFLSSINSKYKEEFEYALKAEKIVFFSTKPKRKERHEFEIILSYTLKDSYDLIHTFFKYWISKNGIMKDDYFVDTFCILAEFLFQDYLESLKYKNREPYFQKMNRFIHTNIFTVHMIVELKLIELYQNNHSLNVDMSVSELKNRNVSAEELLPKNCQIIIDDILSMNGLSLPFHKRYLYSLMFASFLHQQILKQPRLIGSFCYLIDYPENIRVEEFMKAIGLSVRIKEDKILLTKVGHQKLKKAFLAELEDCFVRANIDF